MILLKSRSRNIEKKKEKTMNNSIQFYGSWGHVVKQALAALSFGMRKFV